MYHKYIIYANTNYILWQSEQSSQCIIILTDDNNIHKKVINNLS